MIIRLTTFCFCLLLGGCAVTDNYRYSNQNRAEQPLAGEFTLTMAEELFNQADSKNKILDAISAYEAVLTLDPENIEALNQLASLNLLLGTAFTDGRREKSDVFNRAKHLSETAMNTNSAVVKQIEAGNQYWQSADALSAREARSMLLWVTAVQYEFKEGMNVFQQFFRIRDLANTLPLLHRLEKIDNGSLVDAVNFALAINYYVLPGSMGGDPELADEYIEKLSNRSGNRLFNRWATGRYYSDLTGSAEGTLADLRWVASQDIADFQDPYPWRVYFQSDAISLLSR